jgi:hypothetical protein
VRRRRWRLWFAAALGGCLLLGCTRAVVKQPYPPDPLFLSKKPVAGKVETARLALAGNEPAVPPLPAEALATAPRRPGVAFDPGSAVVHDTPAPPCPAAGFEKMSASVPVPTRRADSRE